MPDEKRTGQGLSGEVAIVTGAAQGLGLGIAAELARQGAVVVIGDIQVEKARNEAKGLSDQGLRVEAAELDVADSRKVDAFFEKVLEKLKRIDILVNNAGVGQKVVPTVELSDEEWDRVIGITLTGVFYCARAAGRIMEKQCSGTIVNISSINGQNPAALVAAYNVAKAGVITLTQTLALELAAYGVRVNAVCPGPVYTEFNRSIMAQRCQSLGISEEQMIERVRSAVPLGRWGEPSDIANMVAFLCGPRSAWMTGDVVRVSGGLAGVSAAPPRRKPGK